MDNTKIQNLINKKEKRLETIRKMYNMKTFNNSIYILGFGAIGKPILWLLLKLIKVDKSKIHVFDKRDFTLNDYEKDIYSSINFNKVEITDTNYLSVLNKVSKFDLIIDCSYGISTYDIIALCNKVGANYVNTCIETWSNRAEEDPCKDTLYMRQIEIMKQNNNLSINHNAVVCMGCNPGNVSIWARIGVDMLSKIYNAKEENQARNAQKIGIQTIHVTERDSQKSSVPKDDHEYCNTWSSDGESYTEEILSCVEGSWGTHEKNVPKDMLSINEDKYFVLNKTAAYVYAQSYVPLNGRFIGNIVPHEECYTIGENLTVRENTKIIYKPTVFYVYHPCNDARMSIEELKDRNAQLQPKYRLLAKELISGRDELGVAFFLQDKSIYWIGSLLSVNEAREVFENKYNDRVNATNLQVSIGCISAILYMVDLTNNNEYKGTMFPENLPYNQIFEWSLPFLGEFVFMKINKDFKVTDMDLKCSGAHEKVTDNWQFEDFLIYK
jgi:homospermidine synthase